MDEFRTVAKLWPAGTDLDLGVDSTNLTLTPPDSANFTRTAAPFVTSADGTQHIRVPLLEHGPSRDEQAQGDLALHVVRLGDLDGDAVVRRRLAERRRWASARARRRVLDLHGDGTLSPDTPIDGAASTYAAGAWPFSGDDHAIGTAPGAATRRRPRSHGRIRLRRVDAADMGRRPLRRLRRDGHRNERRFGGSSFYDTVPAGHRPFAASARPEL